MFVVYMKPQLVRITLAWFSAVLLIVILLSGRRITSIETTIIKSQLVTKELYERRLEKLQLYPKSEQLKIINFALMHRQELKDYLIDRFVIVENNHTELQKRIALETDHNISHKRRVAAPKEKNKYLMNIKFNCTSQFPFLLIIVHSRSSNRAQRIRIRQTWAGITSYKGHTIKTVFLLGKPSDKDGKKMQRRIIREGELFGDIVLGDFVDVYRNLTIKHLMGYQWMLTNCRRVQYITKVDDDIIVNVFHLIDFLTSTNNALSRDRNTIYCSAFVNQGPRRDKRDKWYVSKLEYPHDKYPTYCEGLAYITTPEAVFRIFNVSIQTPPFWIDDVFVTGILAKAAGIKHKQFLANYGYTTIDSGVPSERLENNLFFLEKYYKDAERWTKLWQAIYNRHRSEVLTASSGYLINGTSRD